MKTKLIGASLVVISVGFANAAMANENCTPAKQLVNGAKAFFGAEADLTNIIDPALKVGMEGVNGHPDPTHLLYRYDGFEHAMPVVDGQLQGLDAAKAWSNKGELCSIYEDGPLGDTEGNTVSLFVTLEFPFRREDGVFSVDEIKEGAKDGSKIIKSLAPTGLGFIAPGLKTLAVAPKGDNEDLPELTFLRDGAAKTVPISILNQMQFVRLRDIKSAKIDSVKIEGPYTAAAFFKIDPDDIAAREAKRLAEVESEN